MDACPVDYDHDEKCAVCGWSIEVEEKIEVNPLYEKYPWLRPEGSVAPGRVVICDRREEKNGQEN